MNKMPEIKMLVFLKELESGIVPLEVYRGAFKESVDPLKGYAPEEARKIKRKFRKLKRKCEKQRGKKLSNSSARAHIFWSFFNDVTSKD